MTPLPLRKSTTSSFLKLFLGVSALAISGCSQGVFVSNEVTSSIVDNNLETGFSQNTVVKTENDTSNMELGYLSNPDALSDAYRSSPITGGVQYLDQPSPVAVEVKLPSTAPLQLSQ